MTFFTRARATNTFMSSEWKTPNTAFCRAEAFYFGKHHLLPLSEGIATRLPEPLLFDWKRPHWYSTPPRDLESCSMAAISANTSTGQILLNDFQWKGKYRWKESWLQKRYSSQTPHFALIVVNEARSHQFHSFLLRDGELCLPELLISPDF